MSFIDGCTANGLPTGHCDDLLGGELLDDLAVAAHRLAVERGHHPLAGGQVRLLVEQQHRVLAHDRPEDRVALAGVERGRRAGEHLADVLRPGQHDGLPGRRELDREHVAVAPVPARRDLGAPPPGTAGSAPRSASRGPGGRDSSSGSARRGLNRSVTAIGNLRSGRARSSDLYICI